MGMNRKDLGVNNKIGIVRGFGAVFNIREAVVNVDLWCKKGSIGQGNSVS